MVEDINKKTKKIKDQQDLNKVIQIQLEKAIIGYQQALEDNNSKLIELYYQEICNIYPPLDFVKIWFKKYKHFYDSREDFVQDYLYVFCKALRKWQPRDKRPESRYNGTGEFKNYFWSNLNNYYTNIVKFQAAGIRNIAVICPICNKHTQTLSTHLLNEHAHLLWEHLTMLGHNVDELTRCPLCRSHKIPQTVAPDFVEKEDGLFLTQNFAVKKHMLSKHSPLLFEKFNDLYPEHDTLNVKPVSNYMMDDSGENEINVYETVTGDDKISSLWATNLSDIQRQILELIIVQKSKKIIYLPDVYNCSNEEFNVQLDDLRSKLVICGIEG
jgi:hypothetical protein